MIHQRHRQTDRRHAIASQERALHYSASRGKNVRNNYAATNGDVVLLILQLRRVLWPAVFGHHRLPGLGADWTQELHQGHYFLLRR